MMSCATTCGMVTTLKTLAGLALLGIVLSPHSYAQEDAPAADTPAATSTAPKKDKKGPKPRTTVGRAVENLDYLTEARPNPKAKFFIYLFSSGWCQFCPPVMKSMVADYPKMKKKNVEIILMSPDSDQNIKKYVEQYKAEFPTIRYNAHAVKDVPGNPVAEKLPGAMIVNGKGDILFNGHGSGAQNWENIITQKPEKKKDKKNKKK